MAKLAALQSRVCGSSLKRGEDTDAAFEEALKRKKDKEKRIKKRLEKKRREARSALGVEAPTKKAEWRLQVESLFKGAAHPLRHTFVVGERLPWIFNPRTRAPPGVVATFAVLSPIFRVTAVPDNIYRGLGAMRRRVTWTLFRPRLARKYRRGDGLDVAHNRRYSR